MKINFYNNSILNVYEIDKEEINKYFLKYQLTDTLLKIYQSGNKYLIKVIKNDNIKEILVEDKRLQRSVR